MKNIFVLFLGLTALGGCISPDDSPATSDIYYYINSERDEDGVQYYQISTPFVMAIDSTQDGLWSISISKIVKLKSNEETTVYTLEVKNVDTRDLRPTGLFAQNEFYAHGYVNGVKTFLKRQMKPEYQVMQPDNRPIYLSKYGLYLSDGDVESLGKMDNLFLTVETDLDTEEGLPLSLMVEVKPTVLDTLKLMINDDWKSQLERLQKASSE